MVNELFVNTVNKSLNQVGKPTSRGNYAYNCPKKDHRSARLEVNCDESSPHFGKFHCWGCGDFKGKTVIPLLKFVKANHDLIQEASSILEYRGPISYEKKEESISLPKEFKSLLGKRDVITRQALSYLKSRGVTQDDIEKYNIGYCDNGLYNNYIIIPSYDENGVLNYFMTRSFEKEPFKKTRNPTFSRNIIPFELFINWDLPLVLCEGPFDALAIKRNAIPLLGKDIQLDLMKKIITSKVKKIYITLDTDAIKRALYFSNKFMDEGKEVYLVELGEKDPSELGFKKFTKIIQNTVPLTKYTLMKKKLYL